jgi:CMP-N,N'-diacetyllegionaminic acid synthase
MGLTKTREVLGFIPARGGSVRIPFKNLVDLHGKSLLERAVEQARLSSFLSKVIVSTDSDRVAEVAKLSGAEVIMRPVELAGSDSSTEEAMLHGLDQLLLAGYEPDAVALLQCTSPFRTVAHINQAIALLLDTDCDCVLSVTENQHYYLSGQVANGRRFLPDYTVRPMSQHMPKKFKENGLIYVTKVSTLRAGKSRLGTDNRALVLDAATAMDIDCLEDLEVARRLAPAFFG